VNAGQRELVIVLLSTSSLSSILYCSRSGGYLSAERAQPTVAFQIFITLLPV